MHFVAEIRNYDFDDREVTVQLLFMDTNRPNRMKASFRVKLVHETPAYNKRNRASPNVNSNQGDGFFLLAHRQRFTRHLQLGYLATEIVGVVCSFTPSIW